MTDVNWFLLHITHRKKEPEIKAYGHMGICLSDTLFLILWVQRERSWPYTLPDRLFPIHAHTLAPGSCHIAHLVTNRLMIRACCLKRWEATSIHPDQIDRSIAHKASDVASPSLPYCIYMQRIIPGRQCISLLNCMQHERLYYSRLTNNRFMQKVPLVLISGICH